MCAKAVLTHWKDYPAQHRWEDMVGLIAEVIRDVRPATCIELGTDQGGFAGFLADTVRPWGGQVVTVDIQDKLPVRSTRFETLFPNARRLLWDVLDRDVDRMMAVLGEAARPVMLYCDNGNKPREIELYAPILPVGSLLGAHDYQDEIRPDWVEPFLAGLGYRQHRHEAFAALAIPFDYPVSLTRCWIREREGTP